ncbi:hypothetical protein [Georgenia faecalis]|uniref:Uncharacterized protein n=1 Tax=Georgenia faecalis TaxID=2483799 RepID=A0ABV9DB66_9MICO|nr:hypothetical protein [Georgenia faecalis]
MGSYQFFVTPEHDGRGAPTGSRQGLWRHDLTTGRTACLTVGGWAERAPEGDREPVTADEAARLIDVLQARWARPTRGAFRVPPTRLDAPPIEAAPRASSWAPEEDPTGTYRYFVRQQRDGDGAPVGYTQELFRREARTGALHWLGASGWSPAQPSGDLEPLTYGEALDMLEDVRSMRTVAPLPSTALDAPVRAPEGAGRGARGRRRWWHRR